MSPSTEMRTFGVARLLRCRLRTRHDAVVTISGLVSNNAPAGSL